MLPFQKLFLLLFHLLDCCSPGSPRLLRTRVKSSVLIRGNTSFTLKKLDLYLVSEAHFSLSNPNNVLKHFYLHTPLKDRRLYHLIPFFHAFIFIFFNFHTFKDGGALELPPSFARLCTSSSTSCFKRRPHCPHLLLLLPEEQIHTSITKKVLPASLIPTL
ncbi:hypothetical protein ILYODFUR_020185 [Ilyodon furcidens]|uniref:Secreted protein n=1 Tax=Ilyodon furcidens TaxID=33524 RepID=A0ABV0TK35_9TELE